MLRVVTINRDPENEALGVSHYEIMDGTRILFVSWDAAAEEVKRLVAAVNDQAAGKAGDRDPAPAAAREDDAGDAIRSDIERMKALVDRTDLEGPAEFLSEIDRVTEEKMREDFEKSFTHTNPKPTSGPPTSASQAVDPKRGALDPYDVAVNASLDLERWIARGLTIPGIAAAILERGDFGVVYAAAWCESYGVGVIQALAKAAVGKSACRALERRSEGPEPPEDVANYKHEETR